MIGKIKNHLKMIYGWLTMVSGGGFNTMVVAKNGGRMPVYNSAVDSRTHFGFTEFSEVLMPFGTDIIRIPGIPYVMSIGDILIFAGGALFVFGGLSLAKDYYDEWRERKRIKSRSSDL